MRTNRPRRTKCSKMRGKKSDPHLNPSDPPRRRANKRKGRGTYANDRPPIIGTVGRQSGQVRLRVAHHTNIATLSAHVHQFTQEGATVYTDEWQGFHREVHLACNPINATASITCIVQRCFNRDTSPRPKRCFCYGGCTKGCLRFVVLVSNRSKVGTYQVSLPAPVMN